MDSIHDLGGKEGFGPIPYDPADDGFKHDWEKRMWAINLGIAGQRVTIDWFRHGLECMVPRDYLNFPYFQKWCTNYFMLLVDNDALTMGEARTGKTAQSAPLSNGKPTVDDLLEDYRARNVSFEVDPPAAARFFVGNKVRTQRFTHSGHTRLPSYARDRTGRIIAHHGAHLLADAGAKGEHVGEHLYTVEFSAPELWGPKANANDSVTLELWESYLVST